MVWQRSHNVTGLFISCQCRKNTGGTISMNDDCICVPHKHYHNLESEAATWNSFISPFTAALSLLSHVSWWRPLKKQPLIVRLFCWTVAHVEKSQSTESVISDKSLIITQKGHMGSSGSLYCTGYLHTWICFSRSHACMYRVIVTWMCSDLCFYPPQATGHIPIFKGC